MARITFFGAGYAGLVSGACFAELGHTVVVRDELDRRGLAHVGYAACPEFLAEGTAVRDFLDPDRVVVGAFELAHGEAVGALHEGLNAPVVQMEVPSAELVKLAANAFLATR